MDSTSSQSQQNDLARPYEAVILMNPDSTEDQQRELFRRNKSIIESFKGQIHHIDTWGKRKLANPIAKHQRAVYFHCTFTAGSQAIAELERTMRINDNVLRYLHTRLEDGTDLSTHLEKFKSALADSAAREREREAKSAARRSMRSGGGGRDGGGHHRGHRDHGGRDFGGHGGGHQGHEMHDGAEEEDDDSSDERGGEQ